MKNESTARCKEKFKSALIKRVLSHQNVIKTNVFVMGSYEAPKIKYINTVFYFSTD